MITYKQAFDKITEAYLKNEIRPMDNSFCICGTLSSRGSWWLGDENYTVQEYKKIEFALLNRLQRIYTRLIYDNGNFLWAWENGMQEPCSKEYEDALFIGMCDALDKLKQIHIERGENIDNIQFGKRELIYE